MTERMELIVLRAILSQCPCGGGGSGGAGNQAPMWLILAGILGAWMMFDWTRRTWNREGTSMTGKLGKVVVIVAIIMAVGIAVAASLGRRDSKPAAKAPLVATASGMPRLLDLGSKSCIPCKMMAPILDELKKDYAGRLDVEFIDVWVKENAVKAKEFGINAIPTQIFFDASGKELWRHEGYISKEDILAKWKSLGYDFGPVAAASGAKASVATRAEAG